LALVQPGRCRSLLATYWPLPLLWRGLGPALLTFINLLEFSFKSDFVADEYYGIDATHFLLAHISDSTTMYGILCLVSSSRTINKTMHDVFTD